MKVCLVSLQLSCPAGPLKLVAVTGPLGLLNGEGLGSSSTVPPHGCSSLPVVISVLAAACLCLYDLRTAASEFVSWLTQGCLLKPQTQPPSAAQVACQTSQVVVVLVVTQPVTLSHCFAGCCKQLRHHADMMPHVLYVWTRATTARVEQVGPISDSVKGLLGLLVSNRNTQCGSCCNQREAMKVPRASA